MGKLFSITGALLFFLACGGSADPAKHFSIQLENKAIQQNQQVGVALKNKKDIEFSDLHYYIDGKELPVENGKLTLDLPTLGNKTLVAKFKIEEKTVEVENDNINDWNLRKRLQLSIGQSTNKLTKFGSNECFGIMNQNQNKGFRRTR